MVARNASTDDLIVFVYTIDMEREPTFPKPHEISWHDVTLEMIQEKIDTDDLASARVMAEVRLEGVMAAIQDIEDELHKSEGDIGPTSWELEKNALEEDVVEITKILQTIANETRD